MPQKTLFINYRRDDSEQAVRAIRLALENRLVAGSVFVDTDAIKPGDLWEDRLKQKLEDAVVMLTVVGPGWLSAVNEHHRRRIDLKDDWVRREIVYALRTRPATPMIPVLVCGIETLPSKEALPAALRGLLKSQAHVLHNGSAWSRDFDALLKVLTDDHGLQLKPQSTGTGVALPSPPSNAIAAYLRRLEAETEHLTLMGMGRSLQVELPIAQAYVPLRTTLARSFEVKETERFHSGRAEHEEDVDLCEVFRTAASMRQRGIVLLGEPGSGKTTGARQLAWRLSSGHCPPEELGLPAGITPVLLRFRYLSKEILAQCAGEDKTPTANGLRLFLEHETQCVDAADGEQHPGQELWNLKDPGLLWILDGLDEVIDPAWRQRVSGWIQRAIGNRPQDWFLVTSRFQGYYREGVSLGAKFVEFHVRPLSDEQVERFVRDWFGAAFGKLLGEGTKAQGKAQADSQELLDILARPSYQTGRIRELCTNPLLLTILCIVFHEERKLPTKRAELYAHCVRVLLEYWRRDLYKDDMQTGLQPYDAAAAQTVLARLAWWMHLEQDRTAAPLDDLAAEAAKGLAKVSADSGLGRDGHAFLKRMRDEAGILAMTGDGAGNCGFLHLSFQEYLAANHAASENLARELATRAPESWWREAALLSLRQSRPFCETFFREMLAAELAERHPDLTDRILNETLYFESGPFLEVLSGEQPVARVAAVLRLLRDRVEPLPDLEEICRRLSSSSDAATASMAGEILVRRGWQPMGAASEELFVDEKSGVTFVRIRADEFVMGDDNGRQNERPAHRVRIRQDFWLAKYPVTNAQYERFLKAQGSHMRKPALWDNRRYNQPEQPVIGVNWFEAQAFSEWVGGRLPTEAEWEYGCRAGSTTKYCFGDDPAQLGDYAWFRQNSGGQTQPVGTKKPNAWGLHDMHGNVWEWCHNVYQAYPRCKPGDVIDDAQEDGKVDKTKGRVLRGGSFIDYVAWLLGSSSRIGFLPGSQNDYFGFRPSRTYR